MEFALKKPSAKSVGWFVYMVVIFIVIGAASWGGWNSFTTRKQASILEREMGLLTGKLIHEFKESPVASEERPADNPGVSMLLDKMRGKMRALGREHLLDDPALARYLRVAPAELRALLQSRRAAHPELDEEYLCDSIFLDGTTFHLACATAGLDSGSPGSVWALRQQLVAKWLLDAAAQEHREEMSELDRIVDERRASPAEF